MTWAAGRLSALCWPAVPAAVRQWRAHGMRGGGRDAAAGRGGGTACAICARSGRLAAGCRRARPTYGRLTNPLQLRGRAGAEAGVSGATALRACTAAGRCGQRKCAYASLYACRHGPRGPQAPPAFPGRDPEPRTAQATPSRASATARPRRPLLTCSTASDQALHRAKTCRSPLPQAPGPGALPRRSPARGLIAWLKCGHAGKPKIAVA